MTARLTDSQIVAHAEEQRRAMERGLLAQQIAMPSRLQRLGRCATGRVTGRVLPGERGDWAVEQFEVTEQDERGERLRATISSSSRGRWCSAGTYTRLMRRGTVVMSDTPDELLDLLDFQTEARGRVLIHGLGLGCALAMALAKPEVEHVDVVELSQDVLALVGGVFVADPRVHLHHGDAYTFRFPPRTRWDVAWHDIWDSISTDNDFAALHRRYGGRVGWQGSWCREQAEAADRRWRRENSWWLR